MSQHRGALIAPQSVFVDTSAFKAVADTRDRYHRRALEVQGRLAQGNWGLYTSNLVVAEAHALILNRLGHGQALAFLELMDRRPAAIVWVDEAIHDDATALIRRYEDKDFSLTDATSFVIMERLGLRTAFAFDADFLRYGFTILS